MWNALSRLTVAGLWGWAAVSAVLLLRHRYLHTPRRFVVVGFAAASIVNVTFWAWLWWTRGLAVSPLVFEAWMSRVASAAAAGAVLFSLGMIRVSERISNGRNGRKRI